MKNTLIVTVLLSFCGYVFADTPYQGVVKSIDTDKGIIAVAHQGIAPLGMPVMTMKFKYNGDVTQLEQGARIEFNADKTANGYEITELKVVSKSGE